MLAYKAIEENFIFHLKHIDVDTLDFTLINLLHLLLYKCI